MLTDQKAKYAEGRVRGMGKRDAAVFAGCPPKTAQNAASRYEKDQDVIDAIRRLNHGQDLPASAPAVSKQPPKVDVVKVDRHPAMDLPPPDELEPIPETNDPVVWLRYLMNNASQPIKERNAAARKLAELEAKKKPEIPAKPANKFQRPALKAVG